MSMRSYYDENGQKHFIWEEDSLIPFPTNLPPRSTSGGTPNELHYWHETDDPHRIEVTPPPDGNGEWQSKLWKSPPIWGEPLLHTRVPPSSFRYEPDWIKTPNGEVRIVGMSAVQNVERKLTLAEIAESKAVTINTHGAPLTPAQFESARQAMAREIDKRLIAAMLADVPVSVADVPIKRLSRFSRFKAWLRRMVNEVRELFASGEQEEWDD